MIPPLPPPPASLPPELQRYITDLSQRLNQALLALQEATTLRVVSVNSLPKAALPVRQIVVGDEPRGSCLAWNDGTQWRRVSDNTPIQTTTS